MLAQVKILADHFPNSTWYGKTENPGAGRCVIITQLNRNYGKGAEKYLSEPFAL